MNVARDHEALLQGLGHVGYEIWMTAETAVKVAALDSAKQGSRELAVVYNASLESMLIHTRALTEFFIHANKNPRDDDMLRTHFAEQWEPTPLADVQEVEASWDPINKHLAHLTWKRVEVQTWEVVPAAKAIIRVADAWSLHLRDHALNGGTALYDAFRPDVWKALNAIDGVPVTASVTTTG